MAQALYRKWRPRQWDQVIGQDPVVQTLRNAVRAGRIGHAYLFAGARGTGKTTTARLLAKAVNCTHADPGTRPCDECENCRAVNEGRFLDLIEIDAASNTSVEDVRDLRDKINFSPSQGQYKVYIIDEVHMLSTAAFNALLKTLEEPPPHAIFILATTEVHKIPATVLSRCQRHEFRRVPVAQIAGLLREKALEEGLQVDEDALLVIARQATGSFRDAISLLDQLSSTGERVTLSEAQVVLGTATGENVLAMVESVLSGDAAAGMNGIQSALDAGTDARQFARQIVEYLRGLLMVRMGNAGLVDATADVRRQMEQHAARFQTGRLLETIRLFNAAAVDVRAAWQPGLALELAFAEAIGKPAEAPDPLAQPASRRGVLAGAAEPGVHPPAHAAPAPNAQEPVRPTPEARHEAPRAQPARPETERSTAEPAADLGEIRTQWPRIKAAVKERNSLTAAALASCRTFTLKDRVLILGYQNDVLKKKMEAEGNLELVRQAVQTVLGIGLQVRCVVIGSKTTLDPNDIEMDSDGLLRESLDLGGTVTMKT